MATRASSLLRSSLLYLARPRPQFAIPQFRQFAMATTSAHDQVSLLADLNSILFSTDDKSGDTELVDSIINRIRRLTPDDAGTDLRLKAAHFLTMHLSSIAPDVDENTPLEEIVRLTPQQRSDLELGWSLIDTDFGDTYNETCQLLKIEIAQKLENASRLIHVYDSLLSSDLSEDMKTIVFTTAPFVGDYRTMVEFGANLEKKPEEMKRLHDLSVEMPIPDFGAIYEIAKGNPVRNQGAMNAADLTWDLIPINAAKIRFVNVECDDEQTKSKVISKHDGVGWTDVTLGNLHAKKVGGFVQVTTFTDLPMMLDGPLLRSGICAKGRRTVAMNTQVPNARDLEQTEELDLSKNDGDECVYEGRFHMTQVPMDAPQPDSADTDAKPPEELPVVGLEFECQFVLGKPFE